jgi:hypothetical protein
VSGEQLYSRRRSTAEVVGAWAFGGRLVVCLYDLEDQHVLLVAAASCSIACVLRRFVTGHADTCCSCPATPLQQPNVN